MPIHPTALIDPSANLPDDVEVGPYSIIGPGVTVGANCRIGAYVQMTNTVTIGDDCQIGTGSIIGADPQDLSFDPLTPSGVEIADGNVIREQVTIHRGATEGGATRLGKSNFLMTAAHVGHDCQIGENNVIANACLLGGHVRVGSRCFLGGSSVYHQHIRVGDLVMVQGNGSMSQDVPPFVVAGLLNRVAGLNVVGLRRAGFTTTERKDLKAAYELIFQEGLNLTQALEAAEDREWGPRATAFLDFFRSPSRKGICRRHWRGGTPGSSNRVTS